MRIAGTAHRLLLALVVLSCRFESQAPTDIKRSQQQSYAKSLEAAELRNEGASDWGQVRSLKVRFYETAGYRAAGQAHEKGRFERWLERANEVLVPTLQARLVLDGVVEWTPRTQHASLDALLVELADIDRGDDVDFVVGLVPSAGIASFVFHELGRAEVLGKHLVLRAMDSDAELQLIQSLDALNAKERAELYAGRLQHKETTILLHELGHNLGAVHTKGDGWIMHPSYHHATAAFAPGNRELMEVTLRYRRGELQTEPDWHRTLLKATEDAEDPGAWVEADLASLRTQLGAASSPTPAAPPAPAAEPVAAALVGPTASRAAAPEREGAAIAEPDASAFREALRLHDAGDPVGAWKTLEPLLERHANSYPVQHLGCTLAMSITVSTKARRTVCGRMTALAAAPR